VATAMLKAYQKATSLSGEEKLTAWLMRILVLTCYDMLKLRKREIPVEDVLPFDQPVFTNTEGTVWERMINPEKPM
jgi:DNA-directed RNA polymerase specialized sigma24 family protein